VFRRGQGHLPVRRANAVALVAALALAVITADAGAAVEQGTIVVNRGAAGVLVGMKRAQVVALLGQPLYQNQNGYMEYSKKNLFDVYLDVSTKRVRLIGISGPKFCTLKGVCMWTKNGIAKLKAQYGAALRKFTDETGETGWELRGRFGGRPVFTTFFPDTPKPSGKIIQIFIGYR
jgi:outer membrane protein assembly factor BamE (lipoprotein component of BamABCDE complex)